MRVRWCARAGGACAGARRRVLVHVRVREREHVRRCGSKRPPAEWLGGLVSVQTIYGDDTFGEVYIMSLLKGVNVSTHARARARTNTNTSTRAQTRAQARTHR